MRKMAIEFVGLFVVTAVLIACIMISEDKSARADVYQGLMCTPSAAAGCLESIGAAGKYYRNNPIPAGWSVGTCTGSTGANCRLFPSIYCGGQEYNCTTHQEQSGSGCNSTTSWCKQVPYGYTGC